MRVAKSSGATFEEGGSPDGEGAVDDDVLGEALDPALAGDFSALDAAAPRTSVPAAFVGGDAAINDEGSTWVVPAERRAGVDRPSAGRKMPAGDDSLSDTTRLLRGELAPLSEAIRLDVVVASEMDADTGGRAAAKATSNARRTTEESFFGSIVLWQHRSGATKPIQAGVKFCK